MDKEDKKTLLAMLSQNSKDGIAYDRMKADQMEKDLAVLQTETKHIANTQDDHLEWHKDEVRTANDNKKWSIGTKISIGAIGIGSLWNFFEWLYNIATTK